MPYIAPSRRSRYDGLVDSVVERWIQAGANEGDLNYIISRILFQYLKDPSYAKIVMVQGTLTCIQQEAARVISASYEQGKKEMNGDVI